jgi:hypothetical protein
MKKQSLSLLLWLIPCLALSQTLFIPANRHEADSLSQRENGVGISPNFLARTSESTALKGTTAAGCSPFSFSSANYSGSSSDDIAGGDFNNDGYIDLVEADASVILSGRVKIFLNNGDGTFGSATNRSTTGRYAWRVAVGDLNKDGNLDIVVGHNLRNKITFLMGNGDGTFQAGVDFTVGGIQNSPRLGDMNGDGNLDLVVSDTGSDKVAVYLGNGDGTFQTAPSRVSVSSNPNEVIVSDFNNDGKQDVATSNFLGGDISVALGNGDGTLQTATTFSVSGGVTIDLTATDLNGDNVLDIVSTGAKRVHVLIGNGDGTFQNAVSYAVSTTLTGYLPNLVAEDFDGDGKKDAITPIALGSAYAIYKGLGDGTLDAPCNVSATTAPWAAFSADFNKDGRPDFVTDYGSGIIVYLNTTIFLPIVVTNAATDFTSTSATLNGTINPRSSLLSSAAFEYGTDPTLATVLGTINLPVATIGSGNSVVPVSTNLTGLMGNSTYYFRLTASKSTGGGCGAQLKSAEGSLALRGNANGGASQTRAVCGVGEETVYGEILSLRTYNNPPTALALDRDMMGEYSALGTLIGLLSSTDADAGETFTYTFVPDGCGADNGLVKIVGNQLQVNSIISIHQKQALNVQVKTTDSHGGTFVRCMTLHVENRSFPPEILSKTVGQGQDCDPFTLEVVARDRDEEESIALSLVDAPIWVKLVTTGTYTTLSGTPSQAQVGTYSFKIRMTSGKDVVDQDMKVTVLDVNHAPVFTSEMPSLGMTTRTGQNMQFDFAASDCDGDAITIRPASTLPIWITNKSLGKTESPKGSAVVSYGGIGQGTGLVSLQMIASDGEMEARQGVNVFVSPRYVPLVKSTPAASFDLGKELSYELQADSDDGDPTMFMVTSAPSWMKFSCDGKSVTGTGGPLDRCSGNSKAIFTGTPTANNLPAKFQIMVMDDVRDNSVRSCQEFTLAAENGKGVVKDMKQTNCNGTLVSREQEEVETVRLASLDIPKEFALLGNYPNPFNPNTGVVFNLPEEAQVSLHVFNVSGQEVRTVPAQNFAAGANQRIDLGFADMPSGLYLYKLTAHGVKNTFTATGRMTLVK